jgi:hypothetical protein
MGCYFTRNIDKEEIGTGRYVTFATTGRKRRGDINISENTVKYRDWENRIATP